MTDTTAELTDNEAAEVLASMEADGHDTTTEAPDSPETAPEPVDDQGDDTEADKRPKASREAAKYRTQLREVEAERDTLTGKVEALQRQVIDHHVEKHGLNPALLWDTGLKAADMLTEDGQVDPERVRTAAQETSKKYGLDTRRPDPAQMATDAGDDRAPRLFEGHKS